MIYDALCTFLYIEARIAGNTATVSPFFQVNYTVYHDRSFWLGVHWLIYYPPGQIPDQGFPNFALRGTPMLFIVIKYKIIKNKTSALPTLLYDSEIWTIKQCDKNRFRTAETKYLRRTAGYTLLSHKRNEEILEELHVAPLEDKLCTY
jgi:hypothetical protein